MRVVVLQRMCPAYRVPLFQRLASVPSWQLTLLHSDGVKGSKLVNASAEGFSRVSLKTWAITLSSRGRRNAWVFCPGLLRQLWRLQPDVIVMEGASNLPNSMLAVAYAKLKGVPWIWWSLGEIPGRQYGLPGRLLRWASAGLERRADGVIGYSMVADEYFGRIGVPASRRWVAMNVVDTQRTMAAIPEASRRAKEMRHRLLPDDALVLLFVGALTSQKRVDLLVPIMQAVLRRVPDACLLVVGDGPAGARLRSHAHESGLAGRILFVGQTSGSAADYLQMADLVVLPGLGGLVISEAMCHGVPVVCSQGDGTERSLVVDGQTGRIVPNIEEADLAVEAFAAAIVELLLAPDKRTAMGAAAREHLLSRYSVDHWVEQMQLSVETVASRGGRRTPGPPLSRTL